MICLYCDSKSSKVVDSREISKGIRRRRECLGCGKRFTTYETIQTKSVIVTKSDGRNEEFDEEKIWSSLNKACAKRPVSNRSLNKIILDIESEIDKVGKSEISSKKIGQIIMSGLEQLDRVSYIRFASVYREFENIETFRKEIDTLLSEKNKK
ncbi:MAG: transcriptional regulator NrdR [Dehalococcoidia bacterium]|tara:strand:+ start:2090 stop:2548 length:459 start_codon:yes stop_codon:yes gene_type:complete